MPKPPPALIGELENSLRWSRDHKGEKYKHAGPDEWSYQQGLLFAISLYTGGHLPEMRAIYRSKIENEPRKKSKVVRRRSTTAATKRRVVRRKK